MPQRLISKRKRFRLHFPPIECGHFFALRTIGHQSGFKQITELPITASPQRMDATFCVLLGTLLRVSNEPASCATTGAGFLMPETKRQPEDCRMLLRCFAPCYADQTQQARTEQPGRSWDRNPADPFNNPAGIEADELAGGIISGGNQVRPLKADQV